MDQKVKTQSSKKRGYGSKQRDAEDDSFDWTNIDVDITREGKKIILPGDPAEMDYDSAITQLNRRKAEEAVEYDVTEFIAGAYWDAGLAFYKAMQNEYGFVTTRGIPTWFGELKPDLITVRTGPGRNDVLQLPMGQFTLPNIDNPIQAKPHTNNGVPGFLVHSSVKRKEQAILIKLCADAREILQRESIYRSQAVRLYVNDQGEIEFAKEPEFLDLSRVSEHDIVFNTATARLIETNLFTPMKQTARCRSHNIPLKRGILFEGPYGCGKSLTARVAAKVASNNDWTFITLDRSQGLRQAIEFARLYQPAIIFAEDIDQMADRTNIKVNDLINMMDGILTKDVEIMVVLTTNFIEKIDKALLRPGRFDAVIRIDAPDQEAVMKLMRHYGGGLVADDADLSKAALALAGTIPATIREVVERAKLSMILDGGWEIRSGDMEAAAIGMARHLELLSEKKPEPSPGEKLATALREVLGKGQVTDVAHLTAMIGEVDVAVRQTHRAASEARDYSLRAGQIAGGVAVTTQRIEEQSVRTEDRTRSIKETVEHIEEHTT